MRYLHADLDLDQPRPRLTPDELRSGPLMVRTDSRSIPLPDGSVDVVVTSPPYPKQRVYGREDAREIGRSAPIAAGPTSWPSRMKPSPGEAVRTTPNPPAT